MLGTSNKLVPEMAIDPRYQPGQSLGPRYPYARVPVGPRGAAWILRRLRCGVRVVPDVFSWEMGFQWEANGISHMN